MKNLNKQFNIPRWVKGDTIADESASIEKRFQDRTGNHEKETKESLLEALAKKQEYIKMQEALKTESQQVPDQMNGEVPQGMEQFAHGGPHPYQTGIQPIPGAGQLDPTLASPQGTDPLGVELSDQSQRKGWEDMSGAAKASTIAQGAGTALDLGMTAFGKPNVDMTGRTHTTKQSAGMGAAGGALKGASAGAAFGPLGAGIGIVVGGGAGLLGAGKHNKAANVANHRNVGNQSLQFGQGDFAMGAYGGTMKKYPHGGPHPDPRNPIQNSYMPYSPDMLEAVNGPHRGPYKGWERDNQRMHYNLRGQKNPPRPDNPVEWTNNFVGRPPIGPGSMQVPYSPQSWSTPTRQGMGRPHQDPVSWTNDFVGGLKGGPVLNGSRRPAWADITGVIDGYKNSGQPQYNTGHQFGDGDDGFGNTIERTVPTPGSGGSSGGSSGGGRTIVPRDPRTAVAPYYGSQGKFEYRPFQNQEGSSANIGLDKSFVGDPLDNKFGKLGDYIAKQPGVKKEKGEGKFLDKLAGAARFAPVVGNLLALNNLKKPTTNRGTRLAGNYEKYINDEARDLNMLNQFNTERALTEASGGDSGALRSNLLAAGMNKIKGQSAISANQRKIEASENKFASDYNLKKNMFNAEMDRDFYDRVDKDQAVYDTTKSNLQNALYEDVAKIAKEHQDKGTLETMFGYKWNGEYVVDKKGKRVSDSELQRIIDEINKSKEKKDGE